MRKPFYRLHDWIHTAHPLGYSWPRWLCTVLNRLGGPQCVRPNDF